MLCTIYFYQGYAQPCKILEKRRDKNLCIYWRRSWSLLLIRLALEEAEFVRNSLTQCGFIINFEKSIEQQQK